LRLIPVTDKSLVEFYTPVSIPPNTYPWQEQEVPTIAVLAVVMAFDYKGEACEPIGRLTRLVRRNGLPLVPLSDRKTCKENDSTMRPLQALALASVGFLVLLSSCALMVVFGAVVGRRLD